MIVDKLLQCESVCAGIGAAGRESGGFQRSSLSQQPWALPGVNLVGSEHVETSVWVHVVVPWVELAEISFGFNLVSKVAWEGGQSLDRGEVRLDVRVIIGRARSAEQLWDAEFLEVGDGRARAHLSATVAERFGPSLSGLIQQALVDQAVIPQGLHLIADQPGTDAPGDVFAAPMVEQAVQSTRKSVAPGYADR